MNLRNTFTFGVGLILVRAAASAQSPADSLTA
jgi:hypothetical protein